MNPRTAIRSRVFLCAERIASLTRRVAILFKQCYLVPTALHRGIANSDRTTGFNEFFGITRKIVVSSHDN